MTTRTIQSTVYMTLTTTITVLPTPTASGDGVDAVTAPTATPSPSLSPEEAAVDYGPQVNFSLWLLTVLSCGFLGLRIYCKFVRRRGLWWDDYILSLSWVRFALGHLGRCALLTIRAMQACLLVTATMTSVSVSLGYGRHLATIPQSSLDRMPRVANVAGFFSILAALWSKTSFALTLLRISAEGTWVRKTVWAVILSTNAIMGASAVLIWVPISSQIRIVYFMCSTGWSGAADIVLAVLPWRIIWGMSMTTKEKLGVLCAMSMGVLYVLPHPTQSFTSSLTCYLSGSAGVTSFIKLTKLPSLSSDEPTDSVQVVIFGAAESAITIIAASIPILRALVREASAGGLGANRGLPQFYRPYDDPPETPGGDRDGGAVTPVTPRPADDEKRLEAFAMGRRFGIDRKAALL